MNNLSQYWRKNRSRHKAQELALSLRALRKVAGHIGKEPKQIYWKGMADATDNCILLDSDNLPEKYPVSVNDFDLLVGKVVLEKMAAVEKTDFVKEKVLETVETLPALVVPFLIEFLNSAEEIYVAARAESSVWLLYLAKYWKRDLEILERDPSLPPSATSLFQVWKKCILQNREKPDELHLLYDAPLRILERYTQPLKRIATIPELQQRINNRIELYREFWSKLWEELSQWEIVQPDIEIVPDSDTPVQVSSVEQQTPELGSIDPDLANEISWILEEGEVDLTHEILEAVQDPAAKSLETYLKKGSIVMDPRPDTAQVNRLRRIFKEHVSQVRRAKNRNTRRGLQEGKLDPRRLYRVPIDGKTFKSKQAPGFEDLWQICLVADASASMAGRGQNMRPWRIAERAFATVIQAAREFRNRIEIYGYYGESGNCTLTQLFHGKQLYSLKPKGVTPSGQAIMAVASLLDRKYKKNMIIHITDGAPNSGLPLKKAVDYCQSKGIQVFTIGCGCTPFTQHFLKESFPPGCVYLMKGIENLSEGLETLFKQRILSHELP